MTILCRNQSILLCGELFIRFCPSFYFTLRLVVYCKGPKTPNFSTDAPNPTEVIFRLKNCGWGIYELNF